MKKFTWMMLGAIFITLTASSFQIAVAQNENSPPDYSSDDEGYKIHLQLVVRDVNGHLVSVIESTNTGVLPAYLPDGKLVEGFVDYMFERKLQNNYQIVTVDNTKYEKARWTTGASELEPGKTVSSIRILELCADFEGYGQMCVPTFSGQTDQIYLKIGFTVTVQWTVLRAIS